MKKQSDSPDINPRSTNFCEYLMSYFVVNKITEEQVALVFTNWKELC